VAQGVAQGVAQDDELFLVLHDETPLAAAVRWSGQADPHARGRQHVAHLNAFRRRLARGVALARLLNRTVVLPRFWCYCDKYWSRLSQCTVGEQALATQPLPFSCPMDHVLPVSSWHGEPGRRKARGERQRCALPRRADGHPAEGMPYRTHAWLAQHPDLAISSAQLVSSCELPPPPPPAPPPPPRRARLPPEATGYARGKTTAPPHGPHLERGPTLVLPVGASERRLRAAVAQVRGLKLLHVSLEAAAAVQPCLETEAAAQQLQQLLDLLFRFRWCWRPEEMLEPRNTSEGQAVDVCVWGVEPIVGPPSCGRRREPAACGTAQ